MNRPEKSTCPMTRPIGGIKMSSTSDDTIFPNAAPIITPTARSKTFPRITNALNSFNIRLSSDWVNGGPDYSGGSATVYRGTFALKRGELTRAKYQNRADQPTQNQNKSGHREQFSHPLKRRSCNGEHHHAQKY